MKKNDIDLICGSHVNVVLRPLYMVLQDVESTAAGRLDWGRNFWFWNKNSFSQCDLFWVGFVRRGTVM